MAGSRSTQIVILSGLLCLGAGCPPGQVGGNPDTRDPGPAEGVSEGELPRSENAAAVEAGDARMIYDFGFSLLRWLAEPEADRVTISPHSVASALLLAWNGATGDTRDAMGATLGLPPGSDAEEVNRSWQALDRDLLDSKLELAIANSLWAQEGIELLPAFLERTREAYRAELRSLDFTSPQAAQVINGWVDESTGGKIDSIVPERIPPDVLLYLINAVYFKGSWTDPFDKSQTRERDFHPDGAAAHKVFMMERFGSWAYLERPGLQAVRLPYGDGRFAMYVVLPAAGGLDGWLEKLDGDSWRRTLDSLNKAEGAVLLPRFQFDYSASLRSSLSELGMAEAFTPKADFSALTPTRVMISDVIHKTFIDVNEEGTEAAAATAVEMQVTSVSPTPPFEFIADRPFFFAIVDDETGALLFLGTVRSLA